MTDLIRREAEFLLYQTGDGRKHVEVRFDGETAWLSLGQMADLFQRDKSVISRHIKNVFEEDELEPGATVANFATVQREGEREVGRRRRRGSRRRSLQALRWCPGLHAPESLSDAPVLRGVPLEPKSLTAGETIAVDPPPHHPRSGQAVCYPRVLHPGSDQGALVFPRAGTPDPIRRRASRSAGREESLSSAETNSPGRAQRAEERVQPRIFGAPRRALRSRSPRRPAPSSRSIPHRARARLLLRRLAAPVQVGNQDFAIDLVFFHRGLQCLVAFELKVDKFKPADLGQLS